MISRERMWKIIENIAGGNKTKRMVQNIYDNLLNPVISHNRISEAFTTQSGLRQGGGSSLFLFIVLMDEIMKK